jgi:hypothetical protein
MRSGFSVTTFIAVPPQCAFDFLANPLTASVIDPAVISYEPEGGIMGLGVHNHIRMRLLGIPLRVTSETTDWVPGERMTLQSIRPARPAVGVATHLFEACEGGTNYTWSMEFLPRGPGGRLAAAASAALLGANARKQQQRVRIVLEAAHPSRPA